MCDEPLKFHPMDSAMLLRMASKNMDDAYDALRAVESGSPEALKLFGVWLQCRDEFNGVEQLVKESK